MPIPGVAPLPIAGPGQAVGVDRPRFTVYSSDGSVWHLGDGTDDGNAWIVVMPGMTGLEHPPTTLYSASTPQLAGAAYTGVHVDPREVFIPLAVIASNYDDALNLRRQLIDSFSPLTGNGLLTLEAAQPDGTRRYLDIRVGDGMLGDESVDTAGLVWATYGLVATAFDEPFWYGDPVTPQAWSSAAPVPFFPLAPDLFRLSESHIFGAASIGNIGDVPSYPVWVLQGPATSLTLAHGSDSVTVALSLAAGHTMTIDTDPRRRTIVDQDGATLWGGVADGYNLWPLPRGLSDITITVAGTTAATELTMSYVPRYYRW